MKPVKLKVQGINSFIKMQEIDFKKLIRHGFFGIFGPTGSGKSTIIDAITLALYGEIARFDKDKKSRQFINTNLDKAFISFEFTIFSEEKQVNYLVERTFKLIDKNTVKSDKARLLKIQKENEIIADKIKKVDEEIENIIGISYEDFTRTVILPQGRFSEFLLLANKERCNMLERIFKLETYGEKLSQLIRFKSAKIVNKINILDSKLEVYGEIDRNMIEKDKILYDNQMKDLDLLKKLNLKLLEEKNDLINTNKLISDLKNFEILLTSHISKIKQIDSLDKKLQCSKNANTLIPFVKKYNDTNIKLENLASDYKNYENDLLELNKNKSKAENLFENVKKEMLKIESYHQEIFKYKEAIKIIDETKIFTIERENLLKTHNEFKNKISDFDQNLNSLIENLNKKNNKINNILNFYEENFISTNFRENISIGEKFSSRVNELDEKLADLNKKIEFAKNENLNNNSNLKEYEIKIIEYLKKLSYFEKKQEELLKNNAIINPLELKEKINTLQNIFKNNNETKEKIIENSKTLNNLILEMDNLKLILKDETTKFNLNNKFLEEFSLKLKENENNLILSKIINDLKENDKCPICGNIIKTKLLTCKNNLSQTNLLEKINKLQNEIKLNNELIINSKYKIEMKLSEKQQLEKNLQDLNQKIEDYNFNLNFKILDDLKKQYDDFILMQENINNEKIELEKKINNHKDKISDFSIKKAVLSEKFQKNNLIVSEISKEIETILFEKITLNNKIIELKSKLHFEKLENDIFEKWNFKIKSIDIKNEDLRKKENILKLEINDLSIKIQNIKNQKQEIEIKLQELIISGIEKKKFIDHNNQKIFDLIGNNLNPLQTLKEIENKVVIILNDEKNYKHNLDKVVEEFSAKSEKLNYIKNEIKLYEKMILEQKSFLDEEIFKYNFSSYEEIINNQISEDELNNIKLIITNYNEKLREINQNILILNNKLKNKDIDNINDKIFSNSSSLEQNTDNIEILTKSLAILKEKILRMENNYKIINDLLNEKLKETKQFDLYDDLSKLFKGNKFIEFIAIKQLKYITIEASERLKEMTKGRYALELDDSDFIIRDDFNGGIRRTPKTLSGGETFMVSLCLALALSSKIQLSSKSNLDFFFLDEGFGTLDSNSLEEVINSLEKLRLENLIIGLISHSEELKERVPVKLIITPSNLDFEGSTTKIV